MLERSKRSLINKLASLEEKKATYISKIDTEISKIADNIETIENAIKSIQSTSIESPEESNTEPQYEKSLEDEIDPFSISIQE